MKITNLLIVVLCFLSCNTIKKTQKTLTDENTLLWQVSENGLTKPSYIFGTFHLICKEDIPISEALKNKLKETEKVYMELDMDDPSMLLGGMMMMNMKNGVTLKELFSTADYNKIELFFKDSLRTPINMFPKMKPIFLTSFLYPKMLACKTMSGVEQVLMKIAKENKKEILGLETLAFQSSVFDSIPYEKQAKELLKTIDSLEHYKKYFDTMVHVYKSQNLKEIQNLFTKSEFGMEENQDILLDNRNKNWVTQLNTIMKNKSVFVAVGAAHLVGEMGLINLLRKKGYTVKPITNKF